MSTSWREIASQEAQDDMDGLLGEALPFAQQMLARYGEYFPYAVVLGADGAPDMVGADTGHEQPTSAEVIALLASGIRERLADLRAVAVVSDVRTEESDAIRVEIEHREGHAITALLPYKPKRFGRSLAYGDLRAGPGDHRFWPPHET